MPRSRSAPRRTLRAGPSGRGRSIWCSRSPARRLRCVARRSFHGATARAAPHDEGCAGRGRRRAGPRRARSRGRARAGRDHTRRALREARRAAHRVGTRGQASLDALRLARRPSRPLPDREDSRAR